MERLRRSALFALVACVALAGCAFPASAPQEDVAPAFDPCAHPFPCGDEWPEGLAGPFAAAGVVPFPVEMHDGVVLEAYAHLPELPEGVRAPVLLWSTPYPGSCASNTGRCIPRGDDPAMSSRIDVPLLVEHGYAVVVANVRGTGNSGGCFSMGGADERRDQATLVEAVAAAPWSNGRVGMIGHSYPAYTTAMAAVEAPPALKTAVMSGLMTDLYLAYHTPQGAASTMGGNFQAAYSATVGIAPPFGAGAEHALVGHAPVLPERLCPEAARAALEPQRGTFADDRDEAFWEERRMLDELGNVRASVLVIAGFEDAFMLFHAFQDSDVWAGLTGAPKRLIFGHWGHDLPPPPGALNAAPFGADWHRDTLLPWLDFWLKGIGDAPPGAGDASYHDGQAWRASTSWPPAEAREEVLYLSEGALRAAPGGASTTLTPLATSFLRGASCAPGARVFATEPLEAPVTIAGNAFAYLRVTSDQPRGVFAVDLYDLGPDHACGFEWERGARWLAGGGVDLRHHDGALRGKDFPVGAPTMVRVDLHDQAWRFEAGHRIALVVTADGQQLRAGQPGPLGLTLHAEGDAEASHLVLPVVEGTLGGAAPTLAYPPKPFAPS